MARFKSYINEEPATIYQIADDIAEIELALKNKTQRKQFLKIIRKYNKRFDKLEGWTTEDHVHNMRFNEALKMWRELQDSFKKVIKRKG